MAASRIGMKLLIQYHLRLGDIVRLFPIARHYANQGYQVSIECQPNYWPIFSAITYARPAAPGASTCLGWAKVFNPQIWPDRYNAFRLSGLSWMDFVYGLYPEWVGIDRTILFDRLGAFPLPKLLADYSLPAGYQMIFPFSYSSRPVPLERIFEIAAGLPEFNAERTFLFMERTQKAALVANGFDPDRIRCVDRLAELPALIAYADAVLTVNTSTTIIAGAVRDPDKSKARYFHIREPNPQDNWTAPNQTEIIP